MQAEIEAARLKALREDYPMLSKLFPGRAKSMAKTGEDYGVSQTLVGMGDISSLPGRIVGATIDEKLNDVDWGESLGQTHSESDHIPGSDKERNFGGKMVQGMLRDPTMIPVMVTGVGVAPKVVGKAGVIGGGAILGAGSGFESGLMRPFLEDTDLNAADVAIEAAGGGVVGAGLPMIGKAAKKILRKATLARDPNMAAWEKRAQTYADRNFQDRNNPRNAELLMEAADEAKLAKMKAAYGKQGKIAEELADLKFIPEDKLPGWQQWNEALGQSTETVRPENIVEHLSTAGERMKVNPNVQGLIPEKAAAARNLKEYVNEFLGKDGNVFDFSLQELNKLKNDLGRVIDWDKLHPKKNDFETAELKKAYGMINDLIDSRLSGQGLQSGVDGRAQMSDALKKRDALFKAMRAGNDRNNIVSNIDRNIQNIGIGNSASGHNIERRLQELGEVMPDVAMLNSDLTRANQASKLLQNTDGKLDISRNPFITTGRDKHGVLDKIPLISGRNPKAAVGILRRTKPEPLPRLKEDSVGALFSLPVLAGASVAEETRDKKKKYGKGLPSLKDK
jgi:hypothetical protein